MRIMSIAISLVLLSYLFPISSYAIPLTITAEGVVTSYYDGTGVIEEQGLDVGSAVSYTFIVDTDRLGTEIYQDGTVVERGNSFYAEYVEGSRLPGFENYWTGLQNPIMEMNWGERIGSNYYLHIADRPTFFEIISSASFTDIEIGAALRGYDIVDRNLSANDVSRLNIELTVANIVAAPVPEPTTYSLLVIGFLGLFFATMTKRCQSPTV